MKEGPHRDFYKKLFYKFDAGLNASIDSFRKTITVSVQKVEKRLQTVEDKMIDLLTRVKTEAREEVDLAEVLVNKELRSKIIMSQWTNSFLSASRVDVLDPVTFSLGRLSLNICLVFNEVPPQYLLAINIHKHMVDYIALDSELVVGPALMGLVHLSLHPSLRAPIVLAGALPTVLKLMVKHDNKAILNQCVKLCASLALESSNKTLLAQSGCVHAMFDLILGVHQDVDRHIQLNAILAIQNVMHMNDANRMLAVELNGIKPLLTVMRSTSDEGIIVHAIRTLANIAFGSGYSANCILVAGGGEVLVEVLESGDIVRQPMVAHAVLAAFSNICNSDVNQSHIGSIRGLVEIAIRICEHARDIYLATEAANFLLALSWNNTINKARVSNKGGFTALVKRIIRHAPVQDPESLACAEKMCQALSCALLYKATHESLLVIGGLEECIRLSKTLNNPLLLRCLCMIIVTMVLNPDETLRYHQDDNQYPVEKLNALPVLKKAKFKGYAHLASPPLWLDDAIDILSKTDTELETIGPLVLQEFTSKQDFSKEFCMDVYPDSTVLASRDFKGMIFSIY